MKNLSLFILISVFCLSISCSKEETDSQGSISLKFAATNSSFSKTSTFRLNENVIITDFKISIRDVVFKNESDSDSNLDTDEIQFRGPYQIDLLDNATALSQTIGNSPVPDGLYKELRFKFHKDEDLPSVDPLFDKSIFIEGTIDGIPFVFWHDTSENLDVARSTGVNVTNGIVNFEVHFEISQFLNSLHQIDLSLARDSNNDGLIEIHPNDHDGNQDIAQKLKENIKETADLIDF